VAQLRHLRHLGFLSAVPGALFLALGLVFDNPLEVLLGASLVAGVSASFLKPSVASILVIFVTALGAATTVVGVGAEHWDTVVPRCLSSIALGVKVSTDDHGVVVIFWSDPQRNAAYISSKYGAPIIDVYADRRVGFGPHEVRSFLRSVMCEISVEELTPIAGFFSF